MATKQVTDRDNFMVCIDAATGAEAGVTVEIRRLDGMPESYSVDIVSAVLTAASANGVTAAKARDILRSFLAACRAQARTSGGWT